MDNLAKFLKRLTRSERERLVDIFVQIERGSLKHLDVKKLKGHGGLFRVHTGPMRIIFQKDKSTARVISVERRSEKTYTKLRKRS